MKVNFIKPMLAILAAPLFSAMLSLLKIVPAPPNQGFAALLYLPICILGLPICILLGLQRKLLGGKLLAGLVLAFVFPFVLFILINPLWMPSGMSTCKPAISSGALVRYACVDSSSDNAGYHRDFVVEGFKGWPLMRVVEK